MDLTGRSEARRRMSTKPPHVNSHGRSNQDVSSTLTASTNTKIYFDDRVPPGYLYSYEVFVKTFKDEPLSANK